MPTTCEWCGEHTYGRECGACALMKESNPLILEWVRRVVTHQVNLLQREFRSELKEHAHQHYTEGHDYEG